MHVVAPCRAQFTVSIQFSKLSGMAVKNVFLQGLKCCLKGQHSGSSYSHFFFKQNDALHLKMTLNKNHNQLRLINTNRRPINLAQLILLIEGYGGCLWNQARADGAGALEGST